MGERSITTTEAAELAALEATVERGLATAAASFAMVGQALTEIRDGQLWRADHASWDAYVRARWSMSRSRAHRLIGAAKAAAELGVGQLDVAHGQHDDAPARPAPDSERQVRPLIGLVPGQQREAWDRACEAADGERVTGALVQAAVAQLGGAGGLHSSDSSEHYTPTELVELIATFLRGIELDPCSPGLERSTVPSTRWFTREDDGLARPWVARSVYMNPPWARGDGGAGPWVHKLVEAHESGQVEEAIALVPARVDTAWWQELSPYPWCAIEGRLTFVDETGKPHASGAQFPSALVYLGPAELLAGFATTFSELGPIYRRYVARRAA